MHQTTVRHEEYALGQDPGRCDIFQSKSCGYKNRIARKFQLVSVDTLLNWADIGTKAHTSDRLTSLLRQMPLRLGEEQKQALACIVKSNESSGRSHGGGREDCDAWIDPEECDGCHGEEDRDGCLQPENDEHCL